MNIAWTKNHNDLYRALRRFIPNGRPIEEASDEELMRINWTMNTMPLKCLNWRTPLKVFMEHYRS